ncbi:MAG: site-specific integrase [Prevotella sp.]|jgi:integrase|nr:site-specific integrase [Prevotella sp.]
MGRRRVLYVLPRLNDCGGDLKKTWYVEYAFRNDNTGKLERFRIYKDFKLISTAKKRREYAQKIIEEYTDRIVSGWTPWDLETVVYANNIAYQIQTKVYGNREQTGKNLLYYINAFLQDKEPIVSKKTFQDYTSKLRIFHQWLYSKGKKDIFAQDITNDMVAEFSYYLINERKLERRTIRDFNARISQLYNWMIKKKITNINPAYDLPEGRQREDHSAQPMTKEDAKQLLNHIKEKDEQVYLFCAMIFYCAIRPGTELRLLKVKDINFFTNTITIREENAKTMEAIINMPPEMVRILKALKISNYSRDFYVFGKAKTPGLDCWGKNYFRLEHNKYRDELGMPKEYKLYSWKCTGAIMFAMNGAPITAIRDHLRHTNTTTTDIYLSKKMGKRNDYVKNNFPEL